MTDKELKRMNRQELLNELYKYARENAEFHLRIENCEEKLRQQILKTDTLLAEERQKQSVLKQQIQTAEEENAKLKQRLRNRSVVMEDAGNIADATCKMTGIFEEAQKTAELYVKNVKEMAARQERILKDMEEKSRKDIQKLGDEASKTCIDMRKLAEKECSDLREKTEADCRAMKKEALEQAEAYWSNLTERLENFYNAHQGMREFFGEGMIRIPTYGETKKES